METIQTDAASAAPASQGAVLAAGRTARGMSVGEVASRLKLSVAQVTAIERDDHSQLPAPVFVRGFIRNYARLVNVDMSQWAQPAAASAIPERDIAQPNAYLMKRAPGATIAMDMAPRRHRRMPLMAASAALLLLGLTYYAFVLNPPPMPYPMASNVPLPASQTAMPLIDNAPVAASDPPMVSQPTERSLTLASVDNLQLKKSTDPTSGAGDKGLHFLFNGESWVEVRDGVGKIVFSRINAPGSESIVRGDPPFNVVIGSASGVQLSYNGSQIDLASHANAGVARLRIE